MLKPWCFVFRLHICFMCFRHFWQRKPNKFPSTVFDCRHRIMHTWKHFQLLCEFLKHWGRDALSLCLLYIVIITVYIKMESPWPKASKCTGAVLNLSWRIFFYFKAKEEIQYVSVFFFHFVCKHICSEAGWGKGWFSNCCPETINEFYFKKNWKSLECVRSFNLLYKMY